MVAYWSCRDKIFLRSICDHKMKAFMGRLICLRWPGRLELTWNRDNDIIRPFDLQNSQLLHNLWKLSKNLSLFDGKSVFKSWRFFCVKILGKWVLISIWRIFFFWKMRLFRANFHPLCYYKCDNSPKLESVRKTMHFYTLSPFFLRSAPLQ